MFKPIDWSVQSVEGRLVETDGGELINLYASPAVNPQVSKVPYILQATPGRRRWATRDFQRIAVENEQGMEVSSVETAAANIHGMIVLDNPTYGRNLFGVANEYEFFRVSVPDDIDSGFSPGSSTAVEPFQVATRAGAVATEATFRVSGQARMATDGRYVIIMLPKSIQAFDVGWKPEGADEDSRPIGAFVQVIAPIPNNESAVLPDQDWVDVAWVDGYFVLVARAGQIFHSLLGSINFDQLDFSSAESSPDEIVGMAVHNRRVYIFGDRTIEQWYNAGGEDFAFSRDNSFVINIGCAARDTIQANEAAVLFLGSDRSVHYVVGTAVRRISNATVEEDIAKSDTASAWAWVYTEEGHRFYCLNISTPDGGRKLWCYDMMAGAWHERTATDVQCSVRLWDDRTLVGNVGSPHIQELSLLWPDEDGLPIARTAVSSVLHANDARALVSSFQVDIPYRDSELREASIWETGLPDSPTENADGSTGILARVLGTSAQITSTGGSNIGIAIILPEGSIPLSLLEAPPVESVSVIRINNQVLQPNSVNQRNVSIFLDVGEPRTFTDDIERNVVFACRWQSGLGLYDPMEVTFRIVDDFEEPYSFVTSNADETIRFAQMAVENHDVSDTIDFAIIDPRKNLVDLKSLKTNTNGIISLSWSDDGKVTWQGGKRDQKRLDATRVRWNQLGQFRDRHFRIQTATTRSLQVMRAYITHMGLID